MLEGFVVVGVYVGLVALMWGVLTAVFVRRRCVVCGRHVRRSDWRAERVWVVPAQRVFPAHRACTAVTDAAIERFFQAK